MTNFAAGLFFLEPCDFLTDRTSGGGSYITISSLSKSSELKISFELEHRNLNLLFHTSLDLVNRVVERQATDWFLSNS